MDTAIQSIYRDLEYAKSLIKNRDGKAVDDAQEDAEESWTFIGDDNDSGMAKRVHDWDSLAQSGILAHNAAARGGEDGGRSGRDSFVGDVAA